MTPGVLMSSVLSGDSGERALDLAWAELYDDPPGLEPLPDEEPLIARSVPKRRNEFVTARHCARLALQSLGQQPSPILKGEKGEPHWPDGIVGSLTHCQGFRGAAVGRERSVRSIGIDAEPHDVLPNGVLDAISLPEERAEANALPRGLHWDRILFCAKEATYKAWFPQTKRWLGFEDAHIVFDVDESVASADDTGRGAARGGGEQFGMSGGFVSQILIDPAAVSGPPLTVLRGRWSVRDGLVLTAILL